MKYLFILLFTSCCMSACREEKAKLNCNQLRRGEFFYNIKGGARYDIKRINNSQVETDSATNRVSKWKIDWNGCNYTLTLLSVNYALPGNTSIEDFVLEYEIVKATDKYYIYKELTRSYSQSIASDTIWIR